MKSLIKKFSLVSIILLLVITLAITANSGLVQQVSQYTATNPTTTQNTNATNVLSATRGQVRAAANSNFTVPPKVLLGKPTTVKMPSNFELTSPSGSSASGQVSGNQFTPTELGTYKLVAAGYTYNIESYIKDQPIMEMVYRDNELPLPTIAKRSQDIILPSMQIVTYDDQDNRIILVDDDSISVDIVDDSGKTSYNAGDTFQTSSHNTTMFVRYSYQDSNNQIPKLTQEYTIKVQSVVENKEKPTLNVSAPQNGNVNVKMDLPKATARDKYDTNFRYDITVTHNGNAVKQAKVDPRTGFATELLQDDVYFDNDKNMSFYPTEIGEYVITYKATNSLGSQSDPMMFTIRVLDNTAPQFLKIADHKIPTQWGLQVAKADQANATNPNDSTQLTDSKIYFPTASDIEIVDNLSSTQNLSPDETDRKITVSMSMTNPQGDTILSFSDLFGNPNQENTANSQYGNQGLQLANGFDFNEYHNAIQNDNSKTIEGEYTVTYRARDGQNQVATKTYRITLVRNFEDTVAPRIQSSTFDDLPKYIVANDELDLTLPNPIVSDNNTTRLNTTYTITDGTNEYDIEGGERLVYIKNGNNESVYVTKLVGEQNIIDEGNILQTSATYELSITTEDSVGNYATNGDDNNRVTLTQELRVVPSDYETTFSSSGAISLDPVDSNNTVNFTISDITVGTEQDNQIAGFEVIVQRTADANGNDLSIPQQLDNNISIQSQIDATSIKFPDKASFRATQSGTYQVVVRAFDVNGTNIIHSDTVDITINNRQATTTNNLPQNNGIASKSNQRATQLPVQIEYGKSYQLPTYTETDSPIRTISGGSFELVGNIFTSKSLTTFVFKDTQPDGTELNNGSYYASVSQSDVPVLSLAGDQQMASYLPLNMESNGNFIPSSDTTNSPNVIYLLPKITVTANANNITIDRPTIRYNDSTNISVVDKVTPNSGDVVYDIGAEVVNNSPTSDYYAFRPTSSGKYVITYTASANGQTGSLSFTIYIGDIVSPTFAIRAFASSITVNNGSSFEFKVIVHNEEDNAVGAEDENDNINRFEYTKILYDPNQTEVGRVSGSGAADRINNGSSWTLDKSGIYEARYEVRNPKNGMSTSVIESITVRAASNNSPVPLAVISTILIAVGIVLILGAFVYLVRFRKIKVPADRHKKTTTTTTKKSTTDNNDKTTVVEATKVEAPSATITQSTTPTTQPVEIESSVIQEVATSVDTQPAQQETQTQDDNTDQQ